MNSKEFKQNYLPYIAKHFGYLFEGQKFSIRQDGESCIMHLKNIYCGMIEVALQRKINCTFVVTDTLKENLDIEFTFWSKSGFDTSALFYSMNKVTKKIKKVKPIFY